MSEWLPNPLEVSRAITFGMDEEQQITAIVLVTACKIVEEGEKPCPHMRGGFRKHECLICWVELKQEAGL